MNRFLLTATRRSVVAILTIAAASSGHLRQANGQPNYSEIKRLSVRISESPHDVSALAARAGHLTNAGIVSLAMQDYNKAIALAPSISQFWSSRTVVHLKKEDYPMACSDSMEALRLDARNLPAYQTLARAQLELKSHESALATLKTALEFAPADARLWRLRARANRARGKISEAVADLEAAVAFEAGNAEAWTDLGHFRFLTKDLAGAQKAYEVAYSIDANIVAASIGLGRVHLARGNTASAKVALDRASGMGGLVKPELTSEYAQLSRMLGDASVAKPHWPEAIKHYQTSLKSQQTLDVQRKLADAYVHRLNDLLLNVGDEAGAVSLHGAAVAELPGQADSISTEFAKAWVTRANANAATTEPQFLDARRRLITSLSFHQDTKVQHQLVKTLVKMMEFYAPLPNRRKQAGLIYADALRYSTGDRTLTDWVVAKWTALNL